MLHMIKEKTDPAVMLMTDEELGKPLSATQDWNEKNINIHIYKKSASHCI